MAEQETEPLNPVAVVGTAVDLALGVVALSVDALKQAPELAVKLPVRAASVALVASERAHKEYETLLTRGAELRGTLGGLLAGRLLGPPIVEDEPVEVDPFDLLLHDDDAAKADSQEAGEQTEASAQPPRTPFVVVTTDAAVTETGPATGDLPLEDFDEMSIGTLRVSARQLAIPELELLLMHEREHGRREGVLSLLETRIAQLEQEGMPG